MAFNIYSSTNNDSDVFDWNNPGNSLSLTSGVDISISGVSLAGVAADYVGKSYKFFDLSSYTNINPTISATTLNIGGTNYPVTWVNNLAVDGTFTIAALTDSFTTFLANAGVSSAKSGATDDPDADGVVNLIEYALGGNPMSAASSPSPVLQVSGISPEPVFLTLTYGRASTIGLTYAVQTTTDLTNPAAWTTTGVTQGTPDVNGTTTATIPYDTGNRYLRLSVILSP